MERLDITIGARESQPATADVVDSFWTALESQHAETLSHLSIVPECEGHWCYSPKIAPRLGACNRLKTLQLALAASDLHRDREEREGETSDDKDDEGSSSRDDDDDHDDEDRTFWDNDPMVGALLNCARASADNNLPVLSTRHAFSLYPTSRKSTYQSNPRERNRPFLRMWQKCQASFHQRMEGVSQNALLLCLACWTGSHHVIAVHSTDCRRSSLGLPSDDAVECVGQRVFQ